VQQLIFPRGFKYLQSLQSSGKSIFLPVSLQRRSAMVFHLLSWFIKGRVWRRISAQG